MIHLTVKFNLPSSLLKDGEAFIAEAMRAASQTAQEAAETVFRMETAPVVPEPLAVLPDLAVTAPTSLPSWASEPEECLSCQ